MPQELHGEHSIQQFEHIIPDPQADAWPTRVVVQQDSSLALSAKHQREQQSRKLCMQVWA